ESGGMWVGEGGQVALTPALSRMERGPEERGRERGEEESTAGTPQAAGRGTRIGAWGRSRRGGEGDTGRPPQSPCHEERGRHGLKARAAGREGLHQALFRGGG